MTAIAPKPTAMRQRGFSLGTDLKAMVTIRDAIVRDHAPVCDLFAQLDAYHLELDSDTYQPFDSGRWSLEHFTAFLRDDGKAIFVAEDGQELVAILTCELGVSSAYPMVRPQRIVKIPDLFVSPDQRRRGIARSLVGAAKEWGRARNADRMQLTVHAANAESVSAYRHLGFGDFMHVMALKL